MSLRGPTWRWSSVESDRDRNVVSPEPALNRNRDASACALERPYLEGVIC